MSVSDPSSNADIEYALYGYNDLWSSWSGYGTVFDVSSLDGSVRYFSGGLCGRKEGYDLCDISSLEEGAYVWRVTGLQDEHREDIAWTFCGIQGGAITEVMFQITSTGACVPLSTTIADLTVSYSLIFETKYDDNNSSEGTSYQENDENENVVSAYQANDDYDPDEDHSYYKEAMDDLVQSNQTRESNDNSTSYSLERSDSSNDDISNVENSPSYSGYPADIHEGDKLVPILSLMMAGVGSLLIMASFLLIYDIIHSNFTSKSSSFPVELSKEIVSDTDPFEPEYPFQTSQSAVKIAHDDLAGNTHGEGLT
eukprot:CAMPEP_0182420370 /NCGR_PEP_ID=MMETSP1167-20130531/5123_1 /TAXON_ID=2988 /ORGANISM="Mallomonas Sp, Strain CCMP3275" /LENGTH=310 /DNA_ID=CAMNT_0024596233 /DNA_START=335 /DNA_END=1267 /DNA_ORIENTATION=-